MPRMMSYEEMDAAMQAAAAKAKAKSAEARAARAAARAARDAAPAPAPARPVPARPAPAPVRPEPARPAAPAPEPAFFHSRFAPRVSPLDPRAPAAAAAPAPEPRVPVDPEAAYGGPTIPGTGMFGAGTLGGGIPAFSMGAGPRADIPRAPEAARAAPGRAPTEIPEKFRKIQIEIDRTAQDIFEEMSAQDASIARYPEIAQRYQKEARNIAERSIMEQLPNAELARDYMHYRRIEEARNNQDEYFRKVGAEEARKVNEDRARGMPGRPDIPRAPEAARGAPAPARAPAGLTPPQQNYYDQLDDVGRERFMERMQASQARKQAREGEQANIPQRGRPPEFFRPGMSGYGIPEGRGEPYSSFEGMPGIPEIPQGRAGVLPTAPTGHQINPEMSSVHTPLVQGAADLNQAIRNRAVFDSNQPFQPYPVERLVAPRGELYDKAFRQMQGASGSHLPYLRRAEDVARPAETPSYDEGLMRKYQSPYEQKIINRIEQDAKRNYEENLLPALDAKFVRMGQFGSKQHEEGARKGLADLSRMISERTTEEQNKGYKEAQRSREIDAARQLEMARIYGTMGQTAQAQNMTGAQETMNEADRRRQHQQNILNAQHNQWEQGRDWNQQGTDALIRAAGGVPREDAARTAYAPKPGKSLRRRDYWGIGATILPRFF